MSFLKKLLLTFSICHFTSSIFSQEVYIYARKIVDTMASQSMHGRGYVNGGDSIAANYLKNEFSRIGLKSFGSDYYQRMSFAINTFPNTITVGVNGKQLIPGKDFIVYSHSPKSKGNYKIVFADDKLVENKKKFQKFLKTDFTNKVVIVNDTGTKTKELQQILGNAIHAKAIVSLKDKLTWSMSQTTNDFAIIEILRTSLLVKPKTVSFDIGNKFIPEHPSQNVIGYIQGSVYPDSVIVYSAHYDHLGQMGKDVYFPGANDNASGCAMLLNLANYYSKPENKPKYSIAFMAFCGEEVGLLGSKYYTENPLFPLKNTKFVFNMDIMGTGEEGITVVNGTVFQKEFDKLKAINTENKFIKDVKIRGKSANSDHHHFSEKGVKAFFIYSMGGIKAYHDIYDRPETLPLNEFENIFKLITKFGESLQE
jgi:aminopeptidase YwaD